MPERWRAIPDFPGYEVSDHGRVRSYLKNRKLQGGPTGFEWIVCKKPQRILKQNMRGQYPYVVLRDGPRNWTVKVHTLVLIAFVGPRPDGLMCCHNDGDPTNNHLDNLRWDTGSANMQDMIRHGRYKNGPALAARKFNASEIQQIRIERRNGAVYRELAKRWDTTPMPVFYICVGETYKDCPGPITPRAGEYITAQIGE